MKEWAIEIDTIMTQNIYPSIRIQGPYFSPTFHSLIILLVDIVVLVLTLDLEICSCTNSILLKY